MSIKKLFESTDSTREYVSDTDQQDAFRDVESSRNLKALSVKQSHVLPQIDYTDPNQFAKYGSAYLYYKSAIERIQDFYPYDGSEAEKNEFYNKSLDIERYIFDNSYPRTTGYITIAADGWGSKTGAIKDGYGLPSTLEYITFKAGPGTGSGDTLSALSPDPYSSKFQYSNIYDEDIYTTAGLPTTYGSGSRESNLKSNFDTGVTVEFWLTTGSANTLNTSTQTEKQVIFDMSSSYAWGTADYSRLIIELDATVTATKRSPFKLYVISGSETSGKDKYFDSIGSASINGQPTGISVDTLANWNHYAFVLFNSGSNLHLECYLNGRLQQAQQANFNMPEFNPSGTMARLGALAGLAPQIGDVASDAVQVSGGGKLSGSLDEFRFWKVKRTAREIGMNWFTQVGGGVNTDISNTTLGMYYKFNEGITGVTATDSTVLDYGGRICNGVWTGYGTDSRNTGSAIVSASAAPKEYADPIIYSFHPDVSSLKTQLLETGSYHDRQNNANVVSMLPSWILEEDEDSGNSQVTDLQKMTHIMGTYFDKLHMQITQIPKLKHQVYTSASYKPIPFAQHFPQSLGLYTPEIFVDSTVLEKFANRTLTGSFAEDLNDTKNLIYLNLYNNLTNIYKSKGTAKAIRNVFRCFNIDERLLRLNVYADDTTFELRNNLQQTLVNRTTINHNYSKNLGGVVYQRSDAANGDSIGYISGSQGAGSSSAPQRFALEDLYGFTAEIDVNFPRYYRLKDTITRPYPSASLFGMCTVDTGSATSMNGTQTMWVSNYVASDPGTLGPQPDLANFQVYAVRPEKSSKNVYFKLSSSMADNNPAMTAGPFPMLTSSVFKSVYDDTNWNISVRLQPASGSNPAPSSTSLMVSGGNYSGYDYKLIFQGYRTEIGTTRDSFTLTASVSLSSGSNFLRSAKRLYTGARRTNVTGALLQPTDVNIASARYYAKHISDASLQIHANNFESDGISGSFMDFSPLDGNAENHNILNNKALALSWTFDNVTSSNTDGTFVVTDMSSGSALIRDNFGWIGNLAGYQHTGYGQDFGTASVDVVEKKSINSYKFTNPEMAVASDMILIRNADTEAFVPAQQLPDYYYTLEKSLSAAVTEEMLKFFAGVVDFNNVIGAPVNRYRQNYKALEKLRESFFRKVTKTSTVEKYVEYYKWFDDTLTAIISQLLPASSYFVNDILNTVESHVLERSKYQTPFPTLDKSYPEPTAFMSSDGPVFKWTPSPEPSSPRPTNVSGAFWKKRALRSSVELSATASLPGDSALATLINNQKDNFRKIINSNPHLSQSLPRLFTAEGTQYYGSIDAMRTRAKVFVLQCDSPLGSASYYKGGVNFGNNKNIDFTYNALRPAGPINTENNVFIPENVLVAFTEDIEPLPEIFEWDKQFTPSAKYKRYFKVNHGRNWEGGQGYSNLNSKFAFPFNVISSSVNTGYNKEVIDGVGVNVQITNLHNDVYGDTFDVPMQGPFTDYAVGGHQSRHIALNYSSSTRALDTYTTRPEAWKLLLGTCITTTKTGAIGMVGPDYPWPEANDFGAAPYPMTASQKAWMYRDFVAKRPVNIRNIQMKTGSTILGNYSNNYEVVSTVGAFQNPRAFIENQPTLPSELVWDAKYSSIPTQVRTYLSTRRNTNGHFNWVSEYSTAYLTGAVNKSIIISRFAAPGGIEVMSRGYQDFRSSEYSVYNALPYRNLSVIKPSQGPSGTISQATGSGLDGIRVYDILGKDFGLRSHLARHSARFGRDPIFASNFGASYEQDPNFHKVNRNPKRVIKITNDGDIFNPNTLQVASGTIYDNYYVQYQIPRADRQYSWISASTTGSEMRFFGMAQTWGVLDFQGQYSSSADGYVSYFNFVSASSVVPAVATSLYQPIAQLNILAVDPLTGSGDDNTLGFSSSPDYYPQYINSTLLSKLGGSIANSTSDYLNLLLSLRGDKFKWSWRAFHQQDNPILRKEKKDNILSTFNVQDGTFTNYDLPPVSLRGRSPLVNFDLKTGENITLQAAYNNEKIYFNSTDLNNLVEAPIEHTRTPFNQVLALVSDSADYELNWVMSPQSIFPSTRNEFVSRSTERLNFNNKMWRDTLANRITLGSEFANSFGVHVTTDSYDGKRVLSQSCNPMDEGSLWQTRVSASDAGYYPGTFPNTYRIINPAGELQNHYFFYHIGFASTAAKAVRCLSPAALYARKNTITTLKSVVSPTGPRIAQTGSNDSFSHNPALFNAGKQVDVFAGEAKWEANTQAGVILISGSTSTFAASSSAPWWDSYDVYKQDLQLISRGFSIIPEFRISENIEDYVKYGIANKNKLDTFQISETPTNSTTASFYVDYSNSEFLENFLNIKDASQLNATEIKLVCSAAIRPIFYKGFFPAQRTLDLVSQFSRSYGDGLTAKLGSAYSSGDHLVQNNGGALRPLMQALYSPGILYNSIKSGIAVDYPIVTDPYKVSASYYGAVTAAETNNWAITPRLTSSTPKGTGYGGGEYWDMRLPFETLLNPANQIAGVPFIDIEPHPSCSLDVTASLMGTTYDDIYTRMASNFFGECAAFFLKDENFTTLKSNTIPTNLRFKQGEVYGCRIKLRRSLSGERLYDNELSSIGNNNGYDAFGGIGYDHDAGNLPSTSFPLFQDPRLKPSCKETLTMYSNPRAFGPPIAGRPADVNAIATAVTGTQPLDSFNGFNPAYTPPYMNGECAVDFIFRPQAGVAYDGEKILSELTGVAWRFDPGYTGSNDVPILISSFLNSSHANAEYYIYSGWQINANSMQLSSSLNLLGIENVFKTQVSDGGNEVLEENEIVGSRWVIQPKFETPILNFGDEGVHPITVADGNLTLPTNFGSASVPRGMWHQFGVIPDSPDQGIFIDIDEIPVPWLKYHYEVVNVNSPYNDNDVANNGAKVFREMKSLADLAGFNRKSSTQRLGEIAEGKTIKEAVVAVPYIVESVTDATKVNDEQRNFAATRKKFIEIPKKRFQAALHGSSTSDLDSAGESIRKLIKQMEHYVLPPQFDYISNTRIKPVVMYMFEFEFEFDQDDLSYMWQNLAPRDYKKMELKHESTAHALMNTELLTEDNLLDNPNLRWMVFKVKQKSQTNYYDLITPQVGQASTDIFDFTEAKTGYDLSFNWPYDYFSFVELVKIDTEVLFSSNEKDSSPSSNEKDSSQPFPSNNAQGPPNKNGSDNNQQRSSSKNGSNNKQQGSSKRKDSSRYTQGPSKT